MRHWGGAGVLKGARESTERYSGGGAFLHREKDGKTGQNLCRSGLPAPSQKWKREAGLRDLQGKSTAKGVESAVTRRGK